MMGKKSDSSSMHRKGASDKNHDSPLEQDQQEEKSVGAVQVQETTSRRTRTLPMNRNPSCPDGHTTSRLAASTSSPSLLDGCTDSDKHEAINIERHVHAHNILVVPNDDSSGGVTVSSPPLSPLPLPSTDSNSNSMPFVPPPITISSTTSTTTSVSATIPNPSTSNDDIPIPSDSVFLTSAPPRLRHLTQERPSSAPANYLERISGTLLRLVGDHYLCSTCGRELRTLGDELTMQTNISHIRRALSSQHLNSGDN